MTVYSNIGLVEMTPGDPAVKNAWGTVLNENFVIIDQATNGLATVDVAGSVNVILTSTPGDTAQDPSAIFNLNGALTGDIFVLWPNSKTRMFAATNNTTGDFTLSLGVNNGSGSPAGTTAVLPQGASGFFTSDGTNIAAIEAPLQSDTLTDVTLAGTTTLPGSGEISSAGYIGIGMTPVNILDITQNIDTAAYGSILNSNTGTAASAQWITTNGTDSTSIFHTGMDFATSGPFTANQGGVQSDASAGLLFITNVSAPIVFAVADAEAARFTQNGKGLAWGGYIGSGSFSDGQAFIAPSSSNGLAMQGMGSTDDFQFYNGAGSLVMHVPTGTTNFDVVGNIGAATSSTTGDASVGGDLTVSGTITTGNPWGMVLIGSASASGSSSIAFTGLGTSYRTYLLEYDSVIMGTADTQLLLQMGTGSSPTYDTTAADYSTSVTYNDTNSNASTTITTAAGEVLAGFPSGNLSTTQPIKGKVNFGDITQAAMKVEYDGTSYAVTTSFFQNAQFGGFWTPSAAATAIRIIPSSGVITSGNFRLYGMAQ